MVTASRSYETLFGLLRHGQTRWNIERRIQGRSDSPLTREGHKSADKWGKFLRRYQWHRLLASDQGRAQETAGIINSHLHLPSHSDIRLREQNWGDWEGLTIEKIKTDFSEQLEAEIAKGWKFCAPGGESRLAVTRRSSECLLEAQQRWPGENILVICHQGVIKCLLYSLTKRMFMPGEDPLLLHNSLHFVACSAKQLTPAELNVHYPE